MEEIRGKLITQKADHVCFISEKKTEDLAFHDHDKKHQESQIIVKRATYILLFFTTFACIPEGRKIIRDFLRHKNLIVLD